MPKKTRTGAVLDVVGEWMHALDERGADQGRKPGETWSLPPSQPNAHAHPWIWGRPPPQPRALRRKLVYLL
ncbi:hypothetical protein OG339_20390 [Streptosporangium sp. NBC_01495]|uniref:hypothetical protein n=1 Tax=Streptosporangium sp. NBC_01495 TaxID=2903899 RepID=UPI002E35D0BE|nr:hypothetical protein [Streptosporangium sp. NBC_01495]